METETYGFKATIKPKSNGVLTVQFKTETDDTLKKLMEQEERFKEKLRSAKKQVAAREAELQKKRALVLGKAVIAEIEQNPDVWKIISPIVERHIKTAKDKKMFDFVNPSPTADEHDQGGT
ncbi:hypothetical protein DSCO28_73760 (plasmid) [Desulfosarcina ovata subsp. sediminis]|uniref:Uncharacterized protein n=1 Tax=Desulfosarcina ovata subsp. sediminis TaxID=885957 RepID=A0A5K8A3D3_9BACT|nr:hypothetical protein [Desulfosarcina ovata]BBO86810.1 hypothetical protein DSCO28_73760 [Desulfosarcina ovata subsp. sediminis]